MGAPTKTTLERSLSHPPTQKKWKGGIKTLFPLLLKKKKKRERKIIGGKVSAAQKS